MLKVLSATVRAQGQALYSCVSLTRILIKEIKKVDNVST